MLDAQVKRKIRSKTRLKKYCKLLLLPKWELNIRHLFFWHSINLKPLENILFKIEITRLSIDLSQIKFPINFSNEVFSIHSHRCKYSNTWLQRHLINSISTYIIIVFDLNWVLPVTLNETDYKTVQKQNTNKTLLNKIGRIFISKMY